MITLSMLAIYFHYISDPIKNLIESINSNNSRNRKNVSKVKRHMSELKISKVYILQCI